MPDHLEEVIKRVVAGSCNEADVQAIATAFQSGHISLVTGSRAAGITGDATNAIVITGDNNLIVQGQVAESLQAVLERFNRQKTAIASVDELVQQVRSRIHDDVQCLHGTMPLWGMDRWAPLGELFVDVNILEEVSSNRRSELPDLWRDFKQDPGYRSLDRIGLGKGRQRVSGLEVLDRNTNLMVVGKPGSGKTTYLQRLVTECNAGNLQAHRIPVLIRLREFVEDGRVVNYAVERYLERCWRLSAGETQLVLDVGRSLVLLDGLDEVTGADGQAIAKQIKRFARDYPQVRVIVTCRTQSQESRFERFDYVEVADFNEPQVRAFSEHWFQTVCADIIVGQAKATAFLDQLFREEKKAIRELATTPILLSLVCAVFQQTGKFYSKRSKLYEEGLELLLEQWDKSREIERDEIYRDLSVERRLELLSHLAVKKFEQEQYVLFEQAEIEGYIAEFLGIGLQKSRGVLRAIEAQHGLLIERSQKIWSFSHLTFQEYLVAKWYCIQTKWQNLVKYVATVHWKEVFLVAVTIVENASFLLELMKHWIDTSLIVEDEPQELLNWIYKKSLSVNSIYNSFGRAPRFQSFSTSCKEAAIRAFYFDLALIYNDEFSQHLFTSFKDIHTSDFTLKFGLKGPSDNSLPSEFTLSNSIDPDFGRYLHFASDLACVGAYDFAIDAAFCNGTGHAYDHAIDFRLRSSLLTLKNQLPNLDTFEGSFEQWWRVNGLNWTNQLREVMIQYRDIGHLWSFTSIEKKRLNYYYNANKLLISCLNCGCIVDKKTRNKIEGELLLPIAEIKKHKREEVE